LLRDEELGAEPIRVDDYEVRLSIERA